MATLLTVGKARLFSFVVHNTDGSVNPTAAATIQTGNAGIMRATINPDNPREAAIVGLSPSSGINVTVIANGKQASSLIEVVVSPIDLADVVLGSFSGEIAPPSWA